MLERLVIANTLGAEHDWIINDLEINGVSQLEVKNLSGALFACLYFRGLDVIERKSEVAVTVTYSGSNPRGEYFLPRSLVTLHRSGQPCCR